MCVCVCVCLCVCVPQIFAWREQSPSLVAFKGVNICMYLHVNSYVRVCACVCVCVSV